MTEFFFSGDVDYAPVAKELLPKDARPKEVVEALPTFGEELDTARDFSMAGLEALARAFAEKIGLVDQGAVHAPAPRRHRQEGDAAAVRDAGRSRARAGAQARSTMRRVHQTDAQPAPTPKPSAYGDALDSAALRAGDPLRRLRPLSVLRVRCPYCDFAVDTRTDIPHDDYADAVIAELAARAGWFAAPGRWSRSTSAAGRPACGGPTRSAG